MPDFKCPIHQPRIHCNSCYFAQNTPVAQEQNPVCEHDKKVKSVMNAAARIMVQNEKQAEGRLVR